MFDEHKKEEAIFKVAIKLKSLAERTAYLKGACGDDAELLARVEALLKAHDEAGNFLEVPAFDPGVTLEHSPMIEGPGTTIGRYRLLELIGEGGMGLVYLAEQQEPIRRRAALKIVKLGMDTKQVIARFEAEKQMLALLDHPNIARVYDAGTTETGRPYFVMEYVKGQSITEYCDQHKTTIEDRLKLFRQVCEGVQYAHQKGIIHRDIKPSNILVTVEGDKAVPKIIDFGIAKAVTQPLTGVTLFTQQGQLLGTPEYMSPEQVDMATQDIDTRSDIYSLGVVLYQLLAGVLPFGRESFEKGGFAEIQRVIQEVDPPLPSTALTNLGEEAKKIAERRKTQVVPLARRLHRELEWIPLKAMRKERVRRYRSASELADDIQNYLNGNPLIAGPETAIYRVKKFVRRHAGSVATVILVAAALILGVVISTVMYYRSEKALQREAIARSQAQNAEKVAQEQKSIAETKAEDLRRSMYVNNIQLADSKYKEGDIRRVRELLDSCPNNLRGWEWNRLNYIADQSIMTLGGAQSKGHCAIFSPDGRRIFSGCWDGSIKVWDAANGAELMNISGHEDYVGCLAFSPDGKRLVSGSADKTVKLWDVESGTELMTLRGHDNPVWHVAFSPDGKRIASATYSSNVAAPYDIKIWDAITGVEVTNIQHGGVYVGGLAFSPDGKQLASSDVDKICIWDANSGTEEMTIPAAHRSWIMCVAYSPDGKRIVSCDILDPKIKVWDASTGKEIITLRGRSQGGNCVSYDNNGRFIISGSRDNTIGVWDAATGEEVMTLRGHQGPILSALFSHDGKKIISASGEGTIKIWDVSLDRETAGLVGHHHLVSSVAFSPDGKHILTGGWDGTAKIWNVHTSSETMTLAGQEGVANTGDAIGAEYSPDGKRVASVFRGGTVKVWDVTTGRVLMVLCRGQCQQQQGLAFSPDGNYLAAGGKVWNAQNGTEVMTLHRAEERVRCVTFSPDGKRIASGDHNGMLKVWDVGTGEELLTLRGHEGRVLQIAFSPDGNQMTSGGDDTTVKIWHTITGDELMALHGHADIVLSVKFSPDGKRIISGSRDGTAKVWHATTGVELLTLRAGSIVTSVAFSHDGKTIAAGTFGGGIVLWESEAPTSGYEPRKHGAVARNIVDELYQKNGFYYNVIDRLQSDKTLDEAARKIALQIADSRKWEDAEKLKEQGWEVVRLPDKDAESYKSALENAEKANRLEPNNPDILTTLGAAQYRVGMYEDALETLTKTDKILTGMDEGPNPANLAFTAMTLHRISRMKDAKSSLEQLRELCKQEGHLAWDMEIQSLLTEAEKLIEGEKK